MDFTLPPDDHPLRLEVRGWLAEHSPPTPEELAEAGLVAPGWPPPWGRELNPIEQLIVTQEMEAADVDPAGHNPIGVGWAGPTLLLAGTDEQRDRYLRPLLRGEEFWCQLFSEPGAGSDLASLTTRAVRDGDEYVITGQKVWTTWADRADLGILLARTDQEAAKHRGISYFVVPMRRPGVTVRPIVEMTGNSHFNEVFLDQVRIPADHLVGEENEGWAVAKLTLGNERMSLSSGGAVWGMGPRTADLVELARRHGITDARLRQQLLRLHIADEVQRLLGLRTLSELVAGRQPGPEAAVRKLLADRHGQLLMGLAKDLAGAAGMTASAGPFGEEVGEWHWGFLFSPALTVGGGTAEVLRDLIAEQILGLPKLRC